MGKKSRRKSEPGGQEQAEARPPTAPARRRRPLFLAGLALLSLLLTLGLAELAIRLFIRREPLIRFEQARMAVEKTLRRKYGYGREEVRDEHTRSMRFGEIFRNDEELFWSFAPDVVLPETDWPLCGVVSNSQGLREDHEIPLEKKANEVRLLFLGDSCTFGFLLKHDETVADEVERELRRRFPGLVIECINAGVPGYSLFQGWRFLESRGYRFEPDLVVLNFGWNGTGSWDGKGDLEHYEAWKASRPPAALAWSRLAEVLWKALHSRGARTATTRERDRLLPEEFREILRRVGDSTRERGVDLLLLVGANETNIGTELPAYARSPFQMEQYEFAEKRPFGPEGGPSFVDGVQTMQRLAQTHPASALLLDDVHPTALANRALAADVVKKIEPWLRARASCTR